MVEHMARLWVQFSEPKQTKNQERCEKKRPYGFLKDVVHTL
jgi:hypothetical protein